MSWARFDDQFHLNEDVAPLSDTAWRLYVTSILECARRLSDGKVLRKAVPTWPGAPRGKALRDAIQELIDARRWLPAEEGWEVKGYLDWNPSAEEVRVQRDAASFAKRAAGRIGGIRSGEARREAKSKQSEAEPKQPASSPLQPVAAASSETEAKRSPVPVPVPVLKTDSVVESLSGCTPGQPQQTTPTAAGDEQEDPGRETICPLNLLDRDGVKSMLRELSERLPCPLAVIEHEARDFLSYWTLGDGMGRKRAGWPRVLRERIRKRFMAGELVGPTAPEPKAPAHETFEAREAAHQARLDLAKAGTWGEKLARECERMAPSELERIVQLAESRKRPPIGRAPTTAGASIADAMPRRAAQ